MIGQFGSRAIRLYEQEPGEAFASSRLGLYVKRWVKWSTAGFVVTPRTETIKTLGT